MGKKKSKKKKPRYNAHNRPVGGNNLGCSQQPPPKKPGVTCLFSKLDLTLAKTPKAGDVKVLSVPGAEQNGGTHYIEVISGDKPKKSDADLKIVGAQKTNCSEDTHKKTTVIYGRFEGETGFTSEDAAVKIPIYYPYPSITEHVRSLATMLSPKRIHLSHANCKSGEQQIEVIVFPDRKISFTLEYGYSNADSLDKPAETRQHEFTAKFNYEKNGGDGVEITLKAVPRSEERERDETPTLDKRLSGEIKINGWTVGSDFPRGSGIAWQQLKDIANPAGVLKQMWALVRQTYDGGTFFAAAAFGLLKGKSAGFQAQRRFALTIAVGGELEWSTFYEHDDKDHVVHVDEFSVSGTLFKPELKWAFDDVLLSMVPWVGRILAYLNDQARQRELGGLEIYVAVSGEVKANITGTRKRRLNLSPVWEGEGKLVTSINIELGVSGKIRVDLVTRYETYEAGVKASSGATAEFHHEKKPDFYNNALEIVLVISKTVEDQVRGEAPHPDKASHLVKPAEAKTYLNKTFTAIEEKQLWGDD